MENIPRIADGAQVVALPGLASRHMPSLSAPPRSRRRGEADTSRSRAMSRSAEDFSGEFELGALMERAAAFVFVEVVHLDALRAGVGVVGGEHR